jgi:phage repressor protein C with HTH and peptisase S24 domain
MLTDEVSSMLHIEPARLNDMPSHAGTMGSRIKSGREEAGLSQAALGRACGTSRAAVSQWESDQTEPSGTNLVKIARTIKKSEVWLAEGRDSGKRTKDWTEGDYLEGEHIKPYGESSGSMSNGLVLSKEMHDQLVMVPDILVQAGMGDSGLPEIETFGSDTVKDLWGLPVDYVRGEMSVSLPSNLRIIGLKGDSMAPTLQGSDRAIVDIGDRTPSPPGIFALWDGYGVIVKRIEIIPRSKPPRIKVISDNPLHEPYELGPEDYSIVGRLRGFIRRL